MKNKYFDAICVLGEMLLDCNNELKWKEQQLEMRDKEIETLKIKLEYIENFFTDDVPNRKLS